MITSQNDLEITIKPYLEKLFPLVQGLEGTQYVPQFL